MGSRCVGGHHRTCKTFFVNSKKWCQKLGIVVFRGLCTSWFGSHSRHHMDGSRTLRGSDSERQGYGTAVCGETRTTNNERTMIYCKDSVTPAGPLALCHACIHYSSGDCIINRTPEKQFPGAFPLGLYQAEISQCIPAGPISGRNPRCIPALDETFGCIPAWG